MKRTFWQRVKLNAAVIGAAGILFSQGNLGCASFFGNAAISSFDFCFLLNCNDGALGGLLNFCSPINFTSFAGGSETDQQTFLADCPQ